MNASGIMYQRTNLRIRHTIRYRKRHLSNAERLNRLVAEFKALYFDKWRAELVSQKTCGTPATLISQMAVEMYNLQSQLQQMFDCIEAIDARLDRLVQTANAAIAENTEIFSEISACLELILQRQDVFETEMKNKLRTTETLEK